MNGIRTWTAFGFALLPAAGSAHAQTAPQAAACTVNSEKMTIPAEMRETSGLALSRKYTDILWTHNDSGNDAELFAIAPDGALRARIQLKDVKFTDWEDIEAGSCEGGECLYLADIGDNLGRRARITIYEVLEPDLTATTAEIRRTIVARYTDGPQDAEALFRLPDGTLYIVTKGRQKAIRVYRLNEAGVNGEATLEPVRELWPKPKSDKDWVTAATASPDGKWVAIRSYSTLYIYRTDDLFGNGAPAITTSLLPLAEKQGEAVALDNSGSLWLTSEAEKKEDAPTLAALKCVLAN